jgi:large repetitive protein
MTVLKSCVFIILSFGSLQLYSQSCDCPSAGSCSPCTGGLTSLTLRFNGSAASTITASDQIGITFNNTVAPGATFTFSGSIPNDKFAGPNITLTVNGVNNTFISSNCAGVAFIGSTAGSFTVVAASSKSGGSICCQPADVDSQPPVISNCPGTITQNLINACESVISWTPPTANDNCSVASFSSTHNPGDQFDVGMTPVTYTATDAYGNTTTCAFDVIVHDTMLPTFTACPGNITVSANAACQATVSWTEPVANDNCSVSGVTKTHIPNDVFSIGTTTVTYSALDPSGNEGTCSFTVTVNDQVLPVFTGCPTSIALTAGVNCKSVATWTEPVATDNCSIGNVVKSHSSGSEFDMGETTVTYTATDINGNTASCTFTVTVNYNELPLSSGCPGDLTGIADDSDEAVVTWTEPIFTTRCGSLTVQKNHEPGSRFPVGRTEVIYTATDESGNIAECRFMIDVELTPLEIEISKLVTPDGDGFNDFWKITNVENYPDNRVTVVDRWGSVLYKSSGYDNQSIVWKGTNKDGSILPTGTYFYVLEINYGRQKIKREGFIELVK